MNRLLLYFSCVFLFSSCVKYKELIYIQEGSGANYDPYSIENYKIRPFDNLSIKLNNLEQTITQDIDNTTSTGVARADNAILFLQGYIVDAQGFIDLPRVGPIQVVGLTTNEVKKLVDDRLKEFLNFPSVSVKLVNFRITVLGEVNNPGVFYVYENKITLFQALSLAGDLGDYANRDRIKLIRETDKGTSTKYLNIRDPNVLNSENYFLAPNDIIYVEPTKAKAFNSNSRAVGIGLSALSVVIASVNLVVLILK